MIAFLIGLAVIGVVGGLAGLHYAKKEHASKHGTDKQLPLPDYAEERPRYASRVG